MNIRTVLPLLGLSLLCSCLKKEFNAANAAALAAASDSSTAMDNLTVSPGFLFNTTRNVTVQINTLDNTDQPVAGIKINLLTDFTENGGIFICSYRTDVNGSISATESVATMIDSVVISTDAIGFVQEQKIKISNNLLQLTLGGSKPVEHGLVNPSPDFTPGGNVSVNGFESMPFIKPLGPFNNQGIPAYLSTPNDRIDPGLIGDVNKALPPNHSVPVHHPQYMNPANTTSLIMQQPSQVWVTFVHESSPTKNTLCYFKYPTGSAPTSISAIDTLYAVFPNTSFVNSNGGLVSGNKVSLGSFSPGTSVGWALIIDGFSNNHITNGQATYYSLSALNPETDTALRKHCLLLNDAGRQKLLLTFEDKNRMTGSDDDFNDVVFTVTVNPVSSISYTGIPNAIYNPNDIDNDGVENNDDDYPDDPAKAFNNYSPSQNGKSTLAFEDLWPSKGDYDFNDLVVDYNINRITNAQNKVVQIKAAITTKAIGAGFHNGFGIQLPISPSLISSVTGTDVRGSLVTINANGTEANQAKATIIFYSDAYDELLWPGSGTGVNTTIGVPYVTPKTLNVTITFTEPVNLNVLGLPPFNPFIFTNKNRGCEVHLINQPPTSLANVSLLGTQNDKSNPATGQYYKTANNLPFAINIATTFDYPVEKRAITDAHLKFYQWAASNGTQYTDWYKNKNGYRNTTNIYTH
ncbi:MAG: LruC domain-containing protein [Bacteroidetes bacterium]|nr:LruC domain-containing protein [Bacteroidota bacterium]